MTVTEIRRWYRARPGYWFRPKRFGWGAVPVTWQGWASILVLVALGVLIGGLAETRSMVFLALLVPLIAGFVWLSWAKTDGEWRWRWGQPD